MGVGRKKNKMDKAEWDGGNDGPLSPLLCRNRNTGVPGLRQINKKGQRKG